jgi:hypothetical protein
VLADLDPDSCCSRAILPASIWAPREGISAELGGSDNNPGPSRLACDD